MAATCGLSELRPWVSASPPDATALYGESVYRFGVGNLASTLSTNTFFTISADGLLTPGASAPVTAGTPYFKLMGKGKFTEGTTAAFDYVDLLACVAE